jgi:nitroimidazol reductase NimA-like FMN-containing flavoprotein (pyridoxamine 5'-phosphate oxidase superfamily)
MSQDLLLSITESGLIAVPIIYAFDRENGRFYFTTFKGTKKLRNMQQNKSVSIVVDEYSKSAKKGIIFNGTAEVINPNKNEYQQLLNCSRINLHTIKRTQSVQTNQK